MIYAISQAAGTVELLKVDGGSNLRFQVLNSRLTVKNTRAADRTVIFNNNIIGFGGGGDGGQVRLTNK